MGFNRHQFKEYLKNIEDQYPVFDWEIDGVDVWPIIRTYLFYSLFEDHEGVFVKTKPKSKSKVNIIKLVFLGGLNYFKLFLIPQKKYLFVGFRAHRSIQNGISINRYFDPLMDTLKEGGADSMIVEYSTLNADWDYYRKNRIIGGSVLFAFFAKIQVRKSGLENRINSLVKLDECLEQFCRIYPFDLISLKKRICRKIQVILVWENLFSFLIRRLSIKKLICLTYYSNAGFGALLAAKKNRVTFIDMQHGAQGREHVSYGFVNKEQSLNTIPDLFWVWDELSFMNLTKVLPSHRVLLGRHPFLVFNNSFDVSRAFKIPENLILISLQPLEDPLPHYVLEAMKNYSKTYSWWVRMHPRMSEFKRVEFYKQLEEFDLNGLINTEEATSFPLYTILKSCRVHITGYSGVMFEAFSLGIPSILIDPVGWSMVDDFDNSGEYFYKFIGNESEKFINLVEDVFTKGSVMKPNNLKVDEKIFQEFKELKAPYVKDDR